MSTPESKYQVLSTDMLQVTGDVVVSDEALAYTEEILNLARFVLADENRTNKVDAPAFLEAEVQHGAHDGISLKTAFKYQPKYKDSYLEMAVLEDGVESMSIREDYEHFGTKDLREDPFAQMVVDYFRSHSEASQSV